MLKIILKMSWKLLRAPLWAQSLQAGLLCAFVVLLNVAAGVMTLKVWYNFWLSVFLFALTPTWLLCCGLLFAKRWRWRELALGIFAALFALTWLYMRKGNDPLWQILTGCLCGGCGVLLMSLGYSTHVLGRSLARDVKSGQPLNMFRRLWAIAQGTYDFAKGTWRATARLSKRIVARCLPLIRARLRSVRPLKPKNAGVKSTGLRPAHTKRDRAP
jgi:hypothetical protein